METRAHYTIIGAFTLLMLLSIVGFTLWAGHKDRGKQMSLYDIYLGEKVSGLALNSDVLFCGVRVGSVTKIEISESVPGAVKVRIAIDESTPVREDSEATLENKGLTGILLISISGGTSKAKIIRPLPGEVGRIKYQLSPFAAVMANVPSTVESTNQILYSINKLLSPQNQEKITNIFQSLDTLTTTLARRADSIDSMIISAEQSAKQIEKLTVTLNKIMKSDGAQTSHSLSQAAKRLESVLAATEPGLKQLSKEGIPELRMLLVESRNLIHVLTRIGQKLESDPRRFFFGESVKEYTPK